MFNSPIHEITLNIKSRKQIEEINKFLGKEGETLVNIQFLENDNKYKFRLKNPRNIDRKSINLLRNKEINTIIN